MVSLLPGEYRLLRRNGVYSEKSLFFVKFTESAHRALKNFIDNKYNRPPVIEFNKTNGILQIPADSGSNSPNEPPMVSFNFSISSNITMEGKKGRLESVKFKSGSQQLHSYGALTNRIIVSANEDAFQTTKDRITKVDLEHRKVCTKQIDMNLENVNRRAKADRSKIRVVQKNTKRIPDLMKKPKLLNLLKTARKTTRPITNKSVSAILKRPLRERLIQLLAVRPRKRAEIYAVFDNDCDETDWLRTLETVAIVDNNMYCLRGHLWNDVQENWPSYKEQEKQLVKRNKCQNSTSSTCGNENSTASSQCKIDDEIFSRRYKRPGYINGADGLQTKKHRVSHFSRISNQTDTISNTKCDKNSHSQSQSCEKFCNEIANHPKISSEFITNKRIEIQSKSVKPETNYEKYVGESTDRSSDINFASLDSHKKSYSCNDETNNQISGPLKSGQDITKLKRPAENEFAFVKPANCEISRHIFGKDSDIREHGVIVTEKKPYLNHYVTISNAEQRRQYKDDFHNYFDEFVTLEEEVTPAMQIFDLRLKELEPHKNGSTKFKEIVDDLNSEYDTNKKTFQEKTYRYLHLHEVLSRIKELVREYDEKIVAS